MAPSERLLLRRRGSITPEVCQHLRKLRRLHPGNLRSDIHQGSAHRNGSVQRLRIEAIHRRNEFVGVQFLRTGKTHLKRGLHFLISAVYELKNPDLESLSKSQ